MSFSFPEAASGLPDCTDEAGGCFIGWERQPEANRCANNSGSLAFRILSYLGGFFAPDRANNFVKFIT